MRRRFRRGLRGVTLRAPSEHAERRVLLVGRCRCGAKVECVAGCGWVVAGGWERCTHGT